MAELFWTKKLPTNNGWYWWRLDISHEGVVVYVESSRVVGTIGNIRSTPTDVFGGEWAGPLVEPGGDAIENCV